MPHATYSQYSVVKLVNSDNCIHAYHRPHTYTTLRIPSLVSVAKLELVAGSIGDSDAWAYASIDFVGSI